MSVEHIRRQFSDSIAAKQATMDTCSSAILAACEQLAMQLKQGGKIFIAGNGGSAADAQHFSAELLNRYMLQRRPLPAIALTTDTSTLTAIGNDEHFRYIFSKQLQALAQSKDVFIAISTSGQSENIQQAVHTAQRLQLPIIALTGGTGGVLATSLRPEYDIEIRIPSNDTPRIQETHSLILHVICEHIDRVFGSQS